MAQPYIGEIRMAGFNFAPAGWALCDGQVLAISENETLFQLIGTTYGGDGQNTFALPDLRGRIPIHQGNGRTLAEAGGAENITLTVQQLPVHTHPASALNAPGTTGSPANAFWAGQSSGALYSSGGPTPNANMPQNTLAPIGGSQPHTNMGPFLCINFIISLFGIFPSQS